MSDASFPRIVLVGTQHPGNIGAAARAMKTMGLHDLALVAPLRWPDAVGFDRAAGADDLLRDAAIYATLADAVAHCTSVIGCTARARRVALDSQSPATAAIQICQRCTSGEQVAIVFGRERTGLTNDELQLCHSAIHIPTAPSFGSLNLAAAVQIIAYELRMAQLKEENRARAVHAVGQEALANHQQLEHFFSHWHAVLDRIDFHKGRPAAAALHQLRRIFAKTRLTEREVRLLRGILSDTERQLGGVGNSSLTTSRR